MSSPSKSPPVPHDDVDPQIWKIAWVVLLGPLMTSVDSTVVNISLSTLGRELRVPLPTIQWVVSGYLLALALMLPVSGWLVDRIGAKRVYLGCFTAFTLASLLCGLAPSARLLIAARVLQGMAGGLLAPMAQMMVARGAGRHFARVIGIMAVPVLLGAICGPSLAGAILQHASWRWIFFINLPIGVIATVLAAWILPLDEPSPHLCRFDLVGFLLLSPGLVLALDSLEHFGSGGGLSRIWEFAVSLLLMAFFIVHARRRAAAALIDIRLFADPTFSAAACTQFLSNSIAYGGQLLLPLYLLTILQFSPQKTGLLLAPTGLGMLCSFPLMGALTERYGSRYVSALGGLLSLLGTLPFVLLPVPALSVWAMCAALFIRGAGMGAITIPSAAAAYSSITKDAIPVATTAINIVQRLGGPVATTVLATFLHARAATSAFHNLGGAPAFRATFWLLCTFHLAVMIAALRLPLRASRRPSPDLVDQAVDALLD